MLELLCLGDIGIDLYGKDRFAGGCSLNVARHLFELVSTEKKIGVMGPVGNDEDEQFLANQVTQPLYYHSLLTPHPTTRCHIDLADNGERSFSKYEAQAVENYLYTPEDIKLISEYKNVLTVLYGQSEALFRSLMAQSCSSKIFCDFTDLKDFNSDAGIVREFIDKLDIVFCGLDVHEQKLINDLAALAKEFKKTIVITLGPKGALIYHHDLMYSGAVKSHGPVVDTTGAGDSFIAAFLSQYLKGSEIPFCLNFATNYAGKTVTYKGAFR